MSCSNKKRHTIKPGTPEYGTTEHPGTNEGYKTKNNFSAFKEI